jgi:hypothetical protein
VQTTGVASELPSQPDGRRFSGLAASTGFDRPEICHEGTGRAVAITEAARNSTNAYFALHSGPTIFPGD